MNLNSDFTQRVSMHGKQIAWVDSPIQGVQRRMLDRIGDEVARATTIVKYDPGSEFSPHIHTGGEEFIVLEGVFQDEHGDFPAGSYIRNPPQSRHTPGSKPGCVIFVKLWQFDLKDRTHVRLDFNKMGRMPSTDQAGVYITPLFEDEYETVQIEYWPPNTKVTLTEPEGAEILVLDGDFELNQESFSYQSWLRIPENAHAVLTTGKNGTKIWKKSRHLKHAKPQAT